MRKITTLFALLFFIAAFGQQNPSGTTASGKFKMYIPDMGDKHDSVVLWNGTSKALKFIPTSVLFEGIGGGGSYVPIEGTGTGPFVSGIVRFENPGDPTSFLEIDYEHLAANWFNGSTFSLNYDGLVLTGTDDKTFAARPGRLAVGKLGEGGMFLDVHYFGHSNGNRTFVDQYSNITVSSLTREAPAWDADAYGNTQTSPISVNHQFAGSDGDISVSASTNLTESTTSTTVTVISDTGTDAIIPSVTTTDAGAMPAADKIKLNGIGAGANVVSVNAQTGPVVLNQDNIPNGTINKSYTAIEQTKLSGIAPGATANQSDATTNAAIALKENTANKQNSLSVDGTGLKFPTVDAVNAGILAASPTKVIFTDLYSNINLANQPFLQSTTGTGTFTLTAETDHEGVVNQLSSATGSSTNQYNMPITSLVLKPGMKLEIVFKTGDLSSNSAVNSFQFGFINNLTAGAAGTNQCTAYITKVLGSGNTMTTMQLTNRNSSVQTQTNLVLTNPLLEATWYRFRQTIISMSNVQYDIYDMSGNLLNTANITTNVPTGTLGANTQVACGTTTAVLRMGSYDSISLTLP